MYMDDIWCVLRNNLLKNPWKSWSYGCIGNVTPYRHSGHMNAFTHFLYSAFSRIIPMRQDRNRVTLPDLLNGNIPDSGFNPPRNRPVVFANV
jgi:hypothetical protein